MLFSLLAAVYRGRGHAAFMIMSVDNWVKFVYNEDWIETCIMNDVTSHEMTGLKCVATLTDSAPGPWEISG